MRRVGRAWPANTDHYALMQALRLEFQHSPGVMWAHYSPLPVATSILWVVPTITHGNTPKAQEELT